MTKTAKTMLVKVFCVFSCESGLKPKHGSFILCMKFFHFLMILKGSVFLEIGMTIFLETVYYIRLVF